MLPPPSLDHAIYEQPLMYSTLMYCSVICLFSDQLVFQLDSETQNILIEKYYDLDSSVVRYCFTLMYSTRL